jgi:pantetheine-phosphate adenylyltransferase
MIHAVFPGSFDPLHNGHLDIIQRASMLFDQVTVAILNNAFKSAKLFTADERIGIISETTQHLSNVKALAFEGLLVDFVRHQNAQVILKSLRSAADFDYELHMAQMNHHMYPVETIFMTTDPKWSFVSSSRIKEVAGLGSDVSQLVPETSLQALRRKFSTN